jgi:hypothetical protein
MVESRSTVTGPSPGLAPAAQARLRISPVTLSGWRTWPKVNARSQVPTVEAAITRWPSTLVVDPQRSSSTSSMQSPPAASAWTRVSSLRPGWAAPGRPQIEPLVGRLLDPQPLGQRCRQQQPGQGDRTLVVEGDVDLVQYDMGGWHRNGVLRLGEHDRLVAGMLRGQEAVFIVWPRPRRT